MTPSTTHFSSFFQPLPPPAFQLKDLNSTLSSRTGLLPLATFLQTLRIPDLAEPGLCLAVDFRSGNTSPNTDNLEFLRSSMRHCAAWAGLCSGNNESAGKRRSGRSRKSNSCTAPFLSRQRP